MLKVHKLLRQTKINIYKKKLIQYYTPVLKVHFLLQKMVHWWTVHNKTNSISMF